MAKLKRLLVVSQYYWPERFGINDVVRRLIEQQIEVDVLTGHPNYPQGDFFPGYSGHRFSRETVFGAQVFRVPIVPRRQAGVLRLLINYLSFVVAAVIGGSWKLRGRRHDVIFCYLPSPIIAAIPALWLGLIRGNKVVIWVQDLWPGSTATLTKSEDSLLQRVLERVVRWIYRRADLILISSPAFTEPVAKVLKRDAQRDKIVYLPNSFDPRGAPGSTPTDVDIPHFEVEFPVVFAGNIGRAQAVDTIIEAAQLLTDSPQVQIYLIGGGSMVGYAEDKIRSLSVSNVTLCGQYPTYAMPLVFANAAALLVTLSREEVFEHTVPSKVQAYLSAGKPIVAAVNGETARLVLESQAGLVAPAEDATALAQAIRELSQRSAAEREQMGQQGSEFFAEHYHPASVSLKLQQLLEREI